MSTAPANTNTDSSARRRSPWPLALGGAAMTIAAGVSFMFLLEVPFIRNSGMPNFALMVLGCLLAIAALGRRPRWPGAFATLLSAGFTGLFGYGIYLHGLPQPANATIASSSPTQFELELIDSDDKPVRLRDYAAKGPILLVFYRGFW